MRALSATVAAVLCGLSPAGAEAFREARKFDDPAWAGGADGQTFTGARRGRGWHCAICHVPVDDPPTVVIASDPSGLMVDGVYEPGQRYRLIVEITRERRPGDPSLEPLVARGNGFGAEIVDAEDGEPAGTFDPCLEGNLCRDTADRCDPDACDTGAPATTPVVQRIADGTAVHTRASEQLRWSFDWIAPPPGSGELLLHFAAVDGDSSQDHTGDAVAVARLALHERGPVGSVLWPVGAVILFGRRRARG